MTFTNVGLREAVIIQKYNGKNEIIQINPNIPAGTRVIVVYTPPRDYCYISLGHYFGDISTFLFNVSYQYDSIFTLRQMDVTNAFTKVNLIPQTCLLTVQTEMILTIENKDVVTRQYDAIDVGFLIPNSKLRDFIAEISTTQLQEKVSQIKQELNELQNSKIRGSGIHPTVEGNVVVENLFTIEDVMK